MAALQTEAIKELTKGLTQIKVNGGDAEDFIYLEDGSDLDHDNYDIALTALGFDGTHKETDFDAALENFFLNIVI
ncbi:hypothetical protein FJQ98_16590 [Lysinibacillus agricola]|uniref:Uncharacterized protein n=1 Tax=Lysinibacillus agricola TaxID=2590012 RepID=A0ABX7ARJ8_9BACI|nr:MULTISPECIES: hypothetical protein [Lysinibacillus]KOS61454.1 hypothetical protein AN161_17845 [Lysinibacillus sp. FJAT-14222]QQP10864.1 hypothetical protein FJQ98_16590 [Lysinibacillus agricola]